LFCEHLSVFTLKYIEVLEWRKTRERTLNSRKRKYRANSSAWTITTAIIPVEYVDTIIWIWARVLYSL